MSPKTWLTILITQTHDHTTIVEQDFSLYRHIGNIEESTSNWSNQADKMQLHPILLATLLTTLTTATPLHPRAGGPISKPIPANCTQTNPLPHSTHNSGTVVPISGYKPDPQFTNLNLLYQSYFPSTSSPQTLAKQCFEQCYGFGTGEECISAISGKEIPVPEGYYGVPGGEKMSGCLLFKEFLNPGVFVEGDWEGLLGVDISCPDDKEGE